MKTLKLILSLCIIGLFSTMSFGQITGSAHDFSGETWNSSGEMCAVCHTPHNAKTNANAPLWDRETTAGTFTMYTSNTYTATTSTTPDGSSKLCLSCHDGTVALDNFGGVTNGTNYIDGVQDLGVDMSNDHPVSFLYDAALAIADGELFDPTSAASKTTVLGGTIDADLLKANKVQCASCHDIHNAYGNNKLLVIDNAGSALCLTCHDK